jgi:hypothetical protein
MSHELLPLGVDLVREQGRERRAKARTYSFARAGGLWMPKRRKLECWGAGFAGAWATRSAVAPRDTPLTLPGNASIESWHVADRGTTLATTLEAHGPATPPVLTISGNLAQSLGLYFDVPVGGPRGTATYRAFFDGGVTPFQTGPTGASVPLGGLGITVAMSNSTFDTGHTWNGKLAQWANQTPQARTLIATVTDATKPAILWNARNNRPAIYADANYGELKDTTSNWAANVAGGNDADFTIFLVSKVYTTSGSFRQLLSFTNSGDPDSCWGMGTSGATNWAALKKDDAGTQVFALGAGIDTNWHVHEVVQNGTTVDWVIDGTPLFTGSAQNVGVTTLDIAAFFSGVAFGGVSDAAIGEALTYSTALSAVDRANIRTYLRTGWAI